MIHVGLDEHVNQSASWRNLINMIEQPRLKEPRVPHCPVWVDALSLHVGLVMAVASVNQEFGEDFGGQCVGHFLLSVVC